MKKKLGHRNMVASISVGDDLIIPYVNSQVFSEIDETKGEIYILVKNINDESKNVKLFFKESSLDYTEVQDEEPNKDQ